MKRVLSCLLLSTLSLMSFGFQRDTIPDRVAFDWDVSLGYVFDNCEYSRTMENFCQSGTQHGVRLTPTVGILIPQNENVTHRIRLGLDLFKQSGENLPVSKIFDEFQLYYDVRAKFANGADFEALAGSFRRSFFRGDYDGYAFDPQVLFRDSNVDGMLFKYSGERIWAELGLDWLGMFADAEHPERRERFQILSAGDWSFAGPFHLLWTGVFYHFAGCLIEPNVVDNHMINPMIEWRPSCWFSKASLSAGAILTYQWDREYASAPQTPWGFYSIQSLEKWHVCLSNKLYYGQDLMPLYDKYGSELYFGRRMFRTRKEGFSLTDEITLSYNPHITDWLDLAVYATFNFASPHEQLKTGSYWGCRQIVSLKINLERFQR